MEELGNKLQQVVISEVNSNHILENCSHNSTNKLKENCENGQHDKKILNGICQSPVPSNNNSKQTSTETEESTEISELSPAEHQNSQQNHSDAAATSKNDVEIVEMVRELPDKTIETVKIKYKVYESELELPSIMKLIQKDLSEPYSIYTYRYFIHNWPQLCYLALHENKCVGCIVCKLDIHRQMIKRGYIAMLAVDKDYRKLKIGTTLVQKAIRVSFGKGMQ